MLGLILNENSFQLNGENYLQTHGTAMVTKMAVSFWPSQKINGDDIMTISSPYKRDVDQFIERANKFHPNIKFTVEISENEITFLDTVKYIERFQ